MLVGAGMLVAVSGLGMTLFYAGAPSGDWSWLEMVAPVPAPFFADNRVDGKSAS